MKYFIRTSVPARLCARRPCFLAGAWRSNIFLAGAPFFPRLVPMAQVFYDDSCDLGVLKGKTIAVLGYGSQGHAQAQNMRDTGLNVIIGLRPESKSVKDAREYGFEVLNPTDAAAKADIIQMLAPDTMM